MKDIRVVLAQKHKELTALIKEVTALTLVEKLLREDESEQSESPKSDVSR